MSDDLERKIYLADTNVHVQNPAAFAILSGNVDWLPDEEGIHNLVDKDAALDDSPNDIVLPRIVEWELDSIAKNPKKPSTVRVNARLAKRLFSDLRKETGELIYSGEGVQLPNGARVYGVPHDELQFEEFAKRFHDPHNDQRILWAMHRFLEENPHVTDSFRFVSVDRDFRDQVLETRFQGNRISVEDFRFEQIKDPHQRYTGKVTVPVRDATFSRAERAIPKKKDLELEERLKPNQAVILEDEVGVVREPLFFINDGRTRRLRRLTHYEHISGLLEEQPWTGLGRSYSFEKREDHDALIKDLRAVLGKRKLKKQEDDLQRISEQGFSTQKHMDTYADMVSNSSKGQMVAASKPLFKKINRDLVPRGEQQVYVDMLANDDISVLSVEASHGGGKTLFSTLVGLLKTNEEVYNGVTYMRPMEVIGQDIGFLPGGKESKISRYMLPVEDALQEIFGYHEADRNNRAHIQKQIDHLKNNDYMNFEVATDIAGRTLRREFVIVDEAHLYTRPQMRMLLGRLGRGSKVVFVGDLNQLSAYHNDDRSTRFLNELSSGLAHMPERLCGEPLYAHYKMPDDLSLRSEGSALANKL